MLVNGPLVLDVQWREVRVQGQLLTLSSHRWSVLLLLLATPGETVSKDKLRKMLGDGAPLSMNAIEEVVSRLRRELEPAGLRITTVRSQGYRLEPYRRSTFELRT